jgi:ribbon-helix-helix CopG family protein
MQKQITTIRLTDEDRALIEQLKKRFGLTSTTQVIRLALRLVAEDAPDADRAAGREEG